MKSEIISIETLQKLKKLEDYEQKINIAIEYIDKLKANAPDEIALDKLLKILEGE